MTIVGYIILIAGAIFLVHQTIAERKCSRAHKAYMNKIKTEQPRRRLDKNALIAIVKERYYIDRGIAELQEYANIYAPDGQIEDLK